MSTRKMLSLRSLIILLGLIALAMACAPHMPKRHHGLCKFYVDGTSDTTTARKKRDSSSSSSSGSGEGGSGKTKYTRGKKKPNTKCYEYEDGTKDDGAELKEGVKYTVTVTKTTSS